MADELNYINVSDLEEGEILDYETEEKIKQDKHHKSKAKTRSHLEDLYSEHDLKNALSTYYSTAHVKYNGTTNNLSSMKSINRRKSVKRQKYNVKSKLNSTKNRRLASSEVGKGYKKFVSTQKKSNIDLQRSKKHIVDSNLEFFLKYRKKTQNKFKQEMSSISRSDSLLNISPMNKNTNSNKLQEISKFPSDSFKIKDGMQAVNAVPGSLGEMLLRKQLKGKLKGDPSKFIQGKSDSKNAKLEVAHTIGDESNSSERKVDDDEEDELTLRYIALQSAVKGLKISKENVDSNSLPVSTDTLSMTNCLSTEKGSISTSETTLPDAKTNVLISTTNFPFDLPILDIECKEVSKCSRRKLSCSSFENLPIDMDISNDSSNEMTSTFTKEKQNLGSSILPETHTGIPLTSKSFNNDDQSFSNIVQNSLNIITEKESSQHSSLEFPCDEQTQSFPVEWAYMIPPPSQPDQPANDLNSINNWCYNQNMCIQTMLESSKNNNAGIPLSDSPLSHQYINTEDSCNSYDKMNLVPELFRYSTPIDSLRVEINEPTCDLRDSHAKQYQSFMSSVLQHQNNQVLKSDNENHKIPKKLLKSNNSAIRTLTVVPIDKELIISTKVASGNIKKRTRRRRKSNKGIETLSKNSECDDKELNDIDEDEDILRAQLLKSMSIPVSKKVPKTAPQTAIVPSFVQKKERIANYNATYGKKVDYSNKVAKLQVKGREVLRRNIEVSNLIDRTTLDIGGKYLGTKAPFSEPSMANKKEMSHFKFPKIKPVIITLNEDSDSTDEELSSKKLERRPINNNKDVSSSIDELLKSLRNCSEESSKSKNIQINIKQNIGAGTTNVSLLSENKQEEYKKLRQLLCSKKKQLQTRVKTKSTIASNIKESSPPQHSSCMVINAINSSPSEVNVDANLLYNENKLDNTRIVSSSEDKTVYSKGICSTSQTTKLLESCNFNVDPLHQSSSASLEIQPLISDDPSIQLNCGLVSNVLSSKVDDEKLEGMLSFEQIPITDTKVEPEGIGEHSNSNSDDSSVRSESNVDEGKLHNRLSIEPFPNSVSAVLGIVDDCFVEGKVDMERIKEIDTEDVTNKNLKPSPMKSSTEISTSSDSSDEYSSSSSSSSSSSTSDDSSEDEGADNENYKLNEAYLRKKLLSKRLHLLENETIDNDKELKDSIDAAADNVSVELQCKVGPKTDKYCSETFTTKNIDSKRKENYFSDTSNITIGDSAALATVKIKESSKKDENSAKASSICELYSEKTTLQNVFQIDTVGDLENTNFLANSEKYNKSNCPKSKFTKIPIIVNKLDIDKIAPKQMLELNYSDNMTPPVNNSCDSNDYMAVENVKLASMNRNLNLPVNNKIKTSATKQIQGKLNLDKIIDGQNEKMSIDNNLNSSSVKKNKSNLDQKQKLLQRIREEYAKKFISKNVLSRQITGLLKEATSDVVFRQSILRQIRKLHFEEKKSALSIQKKIQQLLELQQKLDVDNKRLVELQRLGKQVVCSNSKPSSTETTCTIDKKHELERKQLMLKISFLEQSLKLKEDTNVVHNAHKNIISIPSISPLSLNKIKIYESSSQINPNSDLLIADEKQNGAETPIKVRNKGSDNPYDDVLCPHDLLGRCNDDQCTLKHTGTSSNYSHEDKGCSDNKIPLENQNCHHQNLQEMSSPLKTTFSITDNLQKSHDCGQISVNCCKEIVTGVQPIKKPLTSSVLLNSFNISKDCYGGTLSDVSTCKIDSGKPNLNLNISASVGVPSNIDAVFHVDKGDSKKLNDHKIGTEIVLLQKLNKAKISSFLDKSTSGDSVQPITLNSIASEILSNLQVPKDVTDNSQFENKCYLASDSTRNLLCKPDSALSLIKKVESDIEIISKSKDSKVDTSKLTKIELQNSKNSRNVNVNEDIELITPRTKRNLEHSQVKTINSKRPRRASKNGILVESIKIPTKSKMKDNVTNQLHNQMEDFSSSLVEVNISKTRQSTRLRKKKLGT